MILFKDDILDHGGIFDTRTTNKSFTRMAWMLKKMNVENNMFMLYLSQPELQGVDPHSPDLTEEQKARILYEIKVNPWYFIREVVRIQGHGGGPVQFELNRANLAQIWAFLCCIDVMITIPRQIGKTTVALVMAAYSTYILSTNTTIGMFVKDDGLRNTNIKRIKAIRDLLPKFIVADAEKNKFDHTNNKESIGYKKFNNHIETFVPQADKVKAGDQGKGRSLIWTLWDEFAFYYNNELAYGSAMPASDAAREQAMANNIPCANIFATTAGFISTPHGKFAYDMKCSALRFHEKLYDVKDKEALDAMVNTPDSSGVIYIEYNYRQLGKSKKWYETRIRNKTPEDIASNYDNRWIRSGGDKILSKALMDKLNDGILEAPYVSIDECLIQRWYVDHDTIDNPEVKNIPFIIGADTSDNGGNDFTTIVLLNPRDFSVIMTCRCNQSSHVHIAGMIVKLLKKFPNSVFIPERNRAAVLIDLILHLMENEGMNPWTRIFNTYAQDKGDTVNFNDLDLRIGHIRKSFGFTTGTNSRPFLYKNVFHTVVERNHSCIFDKHIIDEICGLVIKNGRIDHAVGGHDDTLVAYLIASWFIMFGKNLHLYGIDRSIIMSVDKSAKGETVVQHGMTQVEIRKRIRKVENILENQNLSNMSKPAYKMELEDLRAKVDESDAISEHMISIHQVDNSLDDDSASYSEYDRKRDLMSIF